MHKVDFELFLGYAETATEDPASFSTLTALTVGKYGLYHLCERFDVSVDILEGWISGRSGPREVVREDVVLFIMQCLANEELEFLYNLDDV